MEYLSYLIYKMHHYIEINYKIKLIKMKAYYVKDDF